MNKIVFQILFFSYGLNGHGNDMKTFFNFFWGGGGVASQEDILG